MNTYSTQKRPRQATHRQGVAWYCSYYNQEIVCDIVDQVQTRSVYCRVVPRALQYTPVYSTGSDGGEAIDSGMHDDIRQYGHQPVTNHTEFDYMKSFGDEEFTSNGG